MKEEDGHETNAPGEGWQHIFDWFSRRPGSAGVHILQALTAVCALVTKRVRVSVCVNAYESIQESYGLESV